MIRRRQRALTESAQLLLFSKYPFTCMTSHIARKSDVFYSVISQ